MAKDKNKIFTKALEGAKQLADDAECLDETVDEWVLQEDVKVIGFQLAAKAQYFGDGYPTADGAWYATVTLTPASTRNVDGQLGEVAVRAIRHLFGSPASGFGWIDGCEEITVMMPAGKYFSLKEGEILAVLIAARNDLGVTTFFTGQALLYYIKDS